MNRQSLKAAINHLWASVIKNVNIDLFSFTISFDLCINQEGNEECHKIIFEGVSSFFFTNGEGKNRFNIKNWENAELSEIYYDDMLCHIKQIQSKLNSLSYESTPNFLIEIWSAALFIEAESIRIDGIQFQLKDARDL